MFNLCPADGVRRKLFNLCPADGVRRKLFKLCPADRTQVEQSASDPFQVVSVRLT